MLRTCGTRSTRFGSPLFFRNNGTASPSSFTGLTTRMIGSQFNNRTDNAQFTRRGYATNPVPIQRLTESFIDGTSATYVEDMYTAWKKDPSSVHASWNSYFRSVDAGAPPGEAHQGPESVKPGTLGRSAAAAAGVDPKLSDQTRLRMLLVRAFQVRGHLLAKLDPLTNGPLWRGGEPQELLPSTYGFTEEDLDRPIDLSNENLILGFLHSGAPHRTLREVYTRLRETYCGTMGVEYMHIPDRVECNWIRERIETPQRLEYTKQQKYHILDRLTWSTLFERFLANKFSSEKRFGVDGCEALIPGMKAMIDTGGDIGVECVVVGMPHRGRLNVLANVVRKPLEAILSEFNKKGDQLHDLGEGSGDVKYHLGTSFDRPTATGKKIHISLLANPSHLEAVNPVVMGKARAKQEYLKDTERTKVLPVLLHGDAAFAGQGVVPECFEMGQWKNFTVGGTVHIIVNNQIGFTTDMKTARLSRASPYPTEVAKMANAPIFHVNGDDPEAVVRAMTLAVEYRQAFHKDVVIDIVCYRRNGHNEGDNPAFTQPLMYEKIKDHPSTLEIYRKRLLEEGVVDEAEIKRMDEVANKEYQAAYEASAAYKPTKMDWLSSYWGGFKSSKHHSAIRSTGVPRDILMQIGEKLTSVPEGFSPHSLINTQLNKKKAMFRTGKGFDWATAEALAFGSLALEGNLIRLTGQDVERGTFTHRHAVLHDQKTDDTYQPLAHVGPNQAPVFIHNSALTEFGGLGFELGFSLENPNSLILWEAQFGDFSNGAQVIFDQFISSGEQKWLRQCGITLLLPHGYDGAGPEHSSARLERFLQMTDSDPDQIPEMDAAQRRQIQETNWQVVNVSTPANYFHVLRRQLRRDFRKPLIVMSPKRLLRAKEAVSSLDDFDDSAETGNGQTRFMRVIPDVCPSLVAPEKVRRVIFCSGNVYYDLAERRETAKAYDVAIVRIEQIAPFPFDHVQAQSSLYPNADICWAQEEPKNMGPYDFVYRHARAALKPQRGSAFEPLYAGRPVSASPATGSYKTHSRQLQQLLDDAFSSPSPSPSSSSSTSSSSSDALANTLLNTITFNLQSQDFTQPWFHKHATRNDANTLLRNQQNGAFLIRPSSQRGCYAMTFVANGEIKHNLIYGLMPGYSLEEKPSSETEKFWTLSALVEHCDFLRHPVARHESKPLAAPAATNTKTSWGIVKKIIEKLDSNSPECISLSWELSTTECTGLEWPGIITPPQQTPSQPLDDVHSMLFGLVHTPVEKHTFVRYCDKEYAAPELLPLQNEFAKELLLHLKTNTTVECLSIIGHEGTASMRLHYAPNFTNREAQWLAKVIRSNTTLTTLDLSVNFIG
eukprot:TRINITY_DN2617_c0_g1_i2.p1 TRINITY_DN2617_c0_g1~~TRINITY_DN2617_c0_g1_i2.p1  ORF type:complete len:1337 (+),score=215.61 TRINITY_DN2617_c0_g1_i2:120-4130(+)